MGKIKTIDLTVSPVAKKTPKQTPIVRSTISIAKRIPKKKIPAQRQQLKTEAAAIAKGSPSYRLFFPDGSSKIVNFVYNKNVPTQNLSLKPPGRSTDQHPSKNSNNVDPFFICVLCKLGPHQNKLGHLFGPGYMSNQSEDFKKAAADGPPIVEIKSKRVTRSTTRSAAAEQDPAIDIYAGMLKVEDKKDKFKFWLHAECLAWSNGTKAYDLEGSGEKIGMEAAIWSSARRRCIYCLKNGAMLACLKGKSKVQAHYPCAKNAQWRLVDEFQSFCGC